mgnify:CR=1 FL=1
MQQIRTFLLDDRVQPSRQAACHLGLVPGQEAEGSSKVDVLLEALEILDRIPRGRADLRRLHASALLRRASALYRGGKKTQARDHLERAQKLLDLGDLVGVEGFVFETRTGELTIHVERWELLAKAYYTAELLGVTDQVHPALFEALHEKNQKIENEATLQDLFVNHGVSAEDFSNTFNSFAVAVKLSVAPSSTDRSPIAPSTGAVFRSFTVIVKVSESNRVPVPSSVTVTVTDGVSPPCASLGVQLTSPVLIT